MTNKTKTIHEALSMVQQNLNAPKNQKNKFGGYNYRSCEDIFEGLKKVLPDGATVTVTDDIVLVSDRFYIKAVASFNYGNESITAQGFAREALNKKGMDESQITGATSSYARKYALNGLFLIDDVKDADHDNKHDKEIPKTTTAINRDADKMRGHEIASKDDLPSYVINDSPNAPPEYQGVMLCEIDEGIFEDMKADPSLAASFGKKDLAHLRDYYLKYLHKGYKTKAEQGAK